MKIEDGSSKVFYGVSTNSLRFVTMLVKFDVDYYPKTFEYRWMGQDANCCCMLKD